MFSLQFPLPSIKTKLSPSKSFRQVPSVLNNQSFSSSRKHSSQNLLSLSVPKSSLIITSSTKPVVEEVNEGNERITDAKVQTEQCRLRTGLKLESIPKHVAIIMDGNARWARKRGLPPTSGHEAGLRSLREILDSCCKLGIRVLTVFAFSTDNWVRPQMEVGFLMRLFERGLEDELENFMRKNIQVSVIGDSSKLPISLQKLITKATETTKNNARLQLIVAVSYSGRHDLVQACQSISQKVKDGKIELEDIDETLINQELETSCTEFPYPDLLIRTSGELRISNFMLWQLAYTELLFVESLWPDFGESKFLEALLSFQRRQRRYGEKVMVERLSQGNTGKVAVSTDAKNSSKDELPSGLSSQLIPKHMAILFQLPICGNWVIKVLTVFAFSSENWIRPQMEVDILMKLFERILQEELENFMRELLELGSSICNRGFYKLPNSLHRWVIKPTETTKNNSFQLIMAVDYRGRNDIVQACQSISPKVKN
ncbi:hypothetical protein MKX01_028377, partial [Papaver californicum]